jgi:hypothetical protein
MKSFIVFGVLTLGVCSNVAAQDTAAQEKSAAPELVMYDPLFWKDKLSLKTAQSRKIEEINREFYDGLRRLRQTQSSRSEMKSRLNDGLQERSMKIWATLHNKQKRKLEKIIEQTSFQGS